METKRVFGLVMSCLIAITMFGCFSDDSTTAVNLSQERTYTSTTPTIHMVPLLIDPHREEVGDRQSLVVPSLEVYVPKDPPDEEEYVTDILLYANCRPGVWQIAIPVFQANEGGCNQILLTAARSANGDFYEVGASFQWGISDSSQVMLSDAWDMKHGVATVQTMQDVFLNAAQEEPMATVVGCVKNQCAVPPQPDCADMLCAIVEVTSVINVEGEWLLDGAMIEPGFIVQFVQSGRDVTDTSSIIHHGYVMHADLDFTIGDYVFHGTMAENHVHISGSVKDLLSDTIVGSWTASRNP